MSTAGLHELADSLLQSFVREPDDELERVIRGVHVLLLKHPLAARHAYRALVAEGRRFASTPEGALWKQRLEDSELVLRGRALWDVMTLGMLEEEGDHLLPTQYVEGLSRAAALDDLEPRLARCVFPDEVEVQGEL